MADAIRFIGNYDVTATGKFLWEILCQVRGLGVGRLVTKNEWARRWPHQPSYIKIVKARPAMDRWLHRGRLWGEWTFRGRNFGLFEFSSDLNRSDWRLIHKHEEAEFTKCDQPLGFMEVPNSFPLPPLQVLLMKKYAKKNGLDESQVPRRAPIELCLDPEFAFLKPLFKLVDPPEEALSIYDEANPELWLDLYGRELPVKVEAWNIGPAHFKERFSSSPEMEKAEEIGGVVLTVPSCN